MSLLSWVGKDLLDRHKKALVITKMDNMNFINVKDKTSIYERN